jgi:hypothetical protein
LPTLRGSSRGSDSAPSRAAGAARHVDLRSPVAGSAPRAGAAGAGRQGAFTQDKGRRAALWGPLSRWYGQGGPGRELAERAGHSKASMSLDRYSHICRWTRLRRRTRTVGFGLVIEKMGIVGGRPPSGLVGTRQTRGICAKPVEGAGNQSSPDCRAREECRSLHAVRLGSPFRDPSGHSATGRPQA